MIPTLFWRAALVAILSVALATPARAESINTAKNQVIVGIVVVSAGIAVLVTLLIVHQKHKKFVPITGCVTSGGNGLSIRDDKDQHTYPLSGDPVGLKPGDRMTLEGKRKKQSGNAFVFEAHSVTKDLGACAP